MEELANQDKTTRVIVAVIAVLLLVSLIALAAVEFTGIADSNLKKPAIVPATQSTGPDRVKATTGSNSDIVPSRSGVDTNGNSSLLSQ